MSEKKSAKKNKSDGSGILLKKLDLLMLINQALSRNLDLHDALLAALHILQDSYNVISAAVLLMESEGKALRARSSIGCEEIDPDENWLKGHSVLGQIASTGRPVVIPRISREPDFTKEIRAFIPQTSRDQTFIGVPIALDYKTLGVLVIFLAYSTKRDYDRALKLMTLVASALLHPIHVQHAVNAEREALLDENVRLKQKLQEEFRFHNLIGNSHEMRDVYEQSARVSRTNTTVLLRGESGTGKELVAEAIHYNSLRSEGPFIRVNCAAIPEGLIESEFFGYEKGAFTGATDRKKGRFEIAHHGTIFLDEVGELSPMTQVKLLRVLQEQAFERVGGTDTIKVDVRMIAATNADLEELMHLGRFRADLYYRLNVFSIFLPPLRDRKTDILLLADHFMLKYGRRLGKAIKRISTPAIDMLMRYHWPGNVRELENCIERATIVCEDQVIHSYHLPPTLQTAESSNTIPSLSLDEAVASYEKEIIQDALKSTRGNRAQAARLLSSTERIIGYKIGKYNIDVTRFKG